LYVEENWDAWTGEGQETGDQTGWEGQNHEPHVDDPGFCVSWKL